MNDSAYKALRAWTPLHIRLVWSVSEQRQQKLPTDSTPWQVFSLWGVFIASTLDFTSQSAFPVSTPVNRLWYELSFSSFLPFVSKTLIELLNTLLRYFSISSALPSANDFQKDCNWSTFEKSDFSNHSCIWSLYTSLTSLLGITSLIRSLHLLLFHNRFHTYYHCSRSTLKIQRSIYQRNSRKNPVRANTSFCVRSDRILCIMMFRYTSYEPYIQRLAGCVIELSI